MWLGNMPKSVSGHVGFCWGVIRGQKKRGPEAAFKFTVHFDCCANLAAMGQHRCEIVGGLLCRKQRSP